MLNLLQISINVEYTRRDFSESMRILNRSKRYHLVFKALSAAILLIASFYLFIFFDPIISSPMPAYAIPFLYIFAFSLWFDLPGYLTARRVFNNFQEGGFEKIVLTVNFDGVFSKTNKWESHSGWDHFVNTFENKELFILVLKAKNFLVFPKRNFSNQAEIMAFRKLAKAKVHRFKKVK